MVQIQGAGNSAGPENRGYTGNAANPRKAEEFRNTVFTFANSLGQNYDQGKVDYMINLAINAMTSSASSNGAYIDDGEVNDYFKKLALWLTEKYGNQDGGNVDNPPKMGLGDDTPKTDSTSVKHSRVVIEENVSATGDSFLIKYQTNDLDKIATFLGKPYPDDRLRQRYKSEYANELQILDATKTQYEELKAKDPSTLTGAESRIIEDYETKIAKLESLFGSVE